MRPETVSLRVVNIAPLVVLLHQALELPVPQSAIALVFLSNKWWRQECRTGNEWATLPASLLWDIYRL